jgi:hypothetical protein
MSNAYYYPPRSTGKSARYDKPEPGDREIEYDLNGEHHTIVMVPDPQGGPHDFLARDLIDVPAHNDEGATPEHPGPSVPASTVEREFSVHFDDATGERTETEEKKEKDGIHTDTITQVFDDRGRLISKDEVRFNEKTDKEVITTEKRSYDDDGDLKGKVTTRIDEEIEFNIDGSGTKIQTAGKRTETKFIDGQRPAVTKYHWEGDLDTGNAGWVKDP